jgi:hypothetical protein
MPTINELRFWYALSLVTLCVIFGTLFYMEVIAKERFVLSKDYYPKNINYTSEDPTILSNGTVQKTLLQDGDYLYEYFYNLPNPFSEFQVVASGVSFNNKTEKRDYQVFVGDTRESLKHIGKLTRRGDGYYVFTVKTKEDYKVSCVSLDDKVIHCLNLNK